MKKIICISLLSVTLFSCSKINSVTIDPSVTTMYKGDTSQFKATIKKEGSPDTTINWQIVEPVSQGTSISKDGKLIIDANEKASELTIRAIAVGDTTKSNTYSVKLDINPQNFYGTWISSIEGINRELTITKSSWELKNSDGSFYNFSRQTWVGSAKNDDTVTKDEFPEGCEISGIVGKHNEFSIGLTEEVFLYINKDKTKLIKTSNEPLTNEIDIVWTKKN